MGASGHDMPRLTVRRHRNWKGQPGYRWQCRATAEHPSGRPIDGFSRDDTFTGSWLRDYPSSLSRAMDGARKHLIRYHRKDRS